MCPVLSFLHTNSSTKRVNAGIIQLMSKCMAIITQVKKKSSLANLINSGLLLLLFLYSNYVTHSSKV